MVNERGLTMTDQAAHQLLTERVQAVAEQMRISVRRAQAYLTDESLAVMVDRMVATLANEAPGADLCTEPRTSSVTVGTLGRLIAGLAEVAQLYTEPSWTGWRPGLCHLRLGGDALTVARLVFDG